MSRERQKSQSAIGADHALNAGPSAPSATAMQNAVGMSQSDSPLYFCMLHLLASGPCSNAAKALEEEAKALGLLPTRTDIFGTEHPLQYKELAARFPHIQPSDVRRALSGLLNVFREQQKPRVCNRNVAPLTLHRQLAWHSKRSLLPTKMLVDTYSFRRALLAHRNSIYCLIYTGKGKLIVTGADDKIVKLWSTQNGMLLASCVGHSGDITDLSKSRDEDILASSSNDGTVRIWSTARETLGSPLSVLRAKGKSVTCVEFSPTRNELLISTSDSGEIKVWDVLNSTAIQQCIVDSIATPIPDAQLGAEQANASVAAPLEIMACDTSSDGQYFACACADGVGRIFTMPNYYKPTRGEGRGGQRFDAKIEACPLACQISAQKESLHFMRFSHSVNFPFGLLSYGLMTASHDGTILVWSRRAKRRWEQKQLIQFPTIEPEFQSRKTKKKIQVVVPEVCIWSLDDTRVIASATDNVIYVWSIEERRFVHRMRGHDRIVYVIDHHPWDPTMIMTAGYDGKIILWDIERGVSLREFAPFNAFFREENMRRELGSQPFEIVDGFFSPDGNEITVSDTCGHIYLISNANDAKFAWAPYQQFFKGEYMQLIRDAQYNVIIAETGQPPVCRPGKDVLCDSTGMEYPENVQSAFQAQNMITSVQRKEAYAQVESDPYKFMHHWYHSLNLAQVEQVDRGGGQGQGQAGAVVGPTGRELEGALEGMEGPGIAAAAAPATHGAPGAGQRGERAAQRGERATQRMRRMTIETDDDDDDGQVQSDFCPSSEGVEEESSDDEISDEDRNMPSSSRPMRRAKKRKKRYGDYDDTSSDDDPEEPRVRTRLRGDLVVAAEAGPSTAAAGPSTSRRVSKKGKGKAVLKTPPSVPRPFTTYQWLLPEHLSATSAAYVPQMGDEVFYIPEGHIKYLKNFEWWESIVGEQKFLPQDFVPAERARVIDIKYFISELKYTIAVVDLFFERLEKQLVLELPHPVEGCADFILEASVVERGFNRRFRKGARIRALWDDTWFDGTIVKEKEQAPEWPDSHFERWFVKYDGADEDNNKWGLESMSSWELFKPGETLPDASTMATGSFSPSVAVGREVVAAMRDANNEIFSQDPDMQAKYMRGTGGVDSHYNAVVPVPMCLDRISKRLTSGYYRQEEALLFDIDLLHENARTFHGEGAITAAAIKLATKLRKAVMKK